MSFLVIRRVLQAASLLFAVTFIIFALMSLRGDSVVQNLLGESATDEQLALRAAQLGLDQPLIVRYGSWLTHAIVGDFGSSWINGAPVTQQLLQRVPVSLSLVTGAVVVTAVLSTVVGLAAAFSRGRIDRALQLVAVTVAALPGFWVALILVTVFAIQLRWFPATGYVSPDRDAAAWLAGLVLPVTALALGAAADTAHQVRGAAVDVLSRDYIRTLRAHGISTGSLIFRHVLRNAAVPGLTVLGLQFVGMLGGAIIIENIFALPGLGSVIVTSAAVGDLPSVLGAVTVIVLVVLAMNLLLDLCAAWLNPKGRAR